MKPIAPFWNRMRKGESEWGELFRLPPQGSFQIQVGTMAKNTAENSNSR